MTIQFVSYSDGSFALHGITEFPGKCRVSLYIDANGVLKDSEYRDARMNVRSLRARADLNRARGIGLAYYLTHTEAGRKVYAETCAK